MVCADDHDQKDISFLEIVTRDGERNAVGVRLVALGSTCLYSLNIHYIINIKVEKKVRN